MGKALTQRLIPYAMFFVLGCNSNGVLLERNMISYNSKEFQPGAYRMETEYGYHYFLLFRNGLILFAHVRKDVIENEQQRVLDNFLSDQGTGKYIASWGIYEIEGKNIKISKISPNYLQTAIEESTGVLVSKDRILMASNVSKDSLLYYLNPNVVLPDTIKTPYFIK